MPSVSEWCTFMISAARPPISCSTRVNCHKGRARSKPLIASSRASSTTVASVAGVGALTRRRWRERSKCVSVHRGVARRPGGSTGRCRKRGISLVARSSRDASTSKSGERSSHATARMVERRAGSFSMYQENASVSRMNRSPSVTLLPPKRCARRYAHDGTRPRGESPGRSPGRRSARRNPLGHAADSHQATHALGPSGIEAAECERGWCRSVGLHGAQGRGAGRAADDQARPRTPPRGAST